MTPLLLLRVRWFAAAQCFRALALTVLLAASLSLEAQSTAFVYQGQLSGSEANATGLYDLEFTLFGAPTNGKLLAGPVLNAGVSLTNGSFWTLVDFGPGVFTGAVAWLGVAITTNGSGTFIELTPRQPIQPVPMALYAATAGSAANISSLYTTNASAAALAAALGAPTNLTAAVESLLVGFGSLASALGASNGLSSLYTTNGSPWQLLEAIGAVTNGQQLSFDAGLLTNLNANALTGPVSAALLTPITNAASLGTNQPGLPGQVLMTDGSYIYYADSPVPPYAATAGTATNTPALYTTNGTAVALLTAIGAVTNGQQLSFDAGLLTNLNANALTGSVSAALLTPITNAASLGTNQPGNAGQVLLTDGTNLYYGTAPLALYAAKAGTAASVPWSALPSPVLTNAAGFQPATAALTNLAAGNGACLSNVTVSVAGLTNAINLLAIPTNGGAFFGNGAGLTNLNVSSGGNAAFAVVARTATNVPWSALPGPVLTNATQFDTNGAAAALVGGLGGLFQPASLALSNLAGLNGAALTNLNAGNLVNVIALGAGLGLQQTGHAGTSDAETSGNNQITGDWADGYVLWWTNAIVATNLHCKFGGKCSATNVIMEIFQTQTYAGGLVNPYANYPTAPLWSNLVTVPYWVGQPILDIPLPSIPLAAGAYTWVVAASPAMANGVFEFYMWYNDPGNANIPRLRYAYMGGSSPTAMSPYATYPASASAGFRIDGYVSVSGNAQTAQYAAVAGMLTNAYTTGLLSISNYPDQSRFFGFIGDSRAGNSTSTTSSGLGTNWWPVWWLTNYPTFSRATIKNEARGGTTWAYWASNYPYSTTHWYLTNRNAAGTTNQECFVSAYCGINDIDQGYSYSQIISNMTSTWSQITNDGAGLIAWTVAPNGNDRGSSAYTALRYQQNAWIRSNYLSWGYGAHRAMLMQPDVWEPDPLDSNYYLSDKEHQTPAGMIEFCKQFDQTFRNANSALSTDTVTNSWLLTSSAPGYPWSLGVGGGVTNLAMTISPSNSVGFSSSISATGGVFMFSPNGTRWRLNVDNSGNLSATQQ